MRSKKKLRIISVGIFFVIVTCLFLVAKGLVERLGVGYGNNETIKSEFTIDDKDTGVLFEEDEVFSLYDYSDVNDLQILEGAEEYEIVLNQIEGVSDKIFEGIGENIDYNYSDITMLGVMLNDSLGLGSSKFREFSSFFIENSLTIIGMFDNRYIVMAYNYPSNPKKELVVVDYDDVEVYQEMEGLFSLGDMRSVKGCQTQYVIKNILGYEVMFLKG